MKFFRHIILLASLLPPTSYLLPKTNLPFSLAEYGLLQHISRPQAVLQKTISSPSTCYLDTLVSVSEIEITSPKDIGRPDDQPAAYSQVSSDQLDQLHITSLKGVSSLVPSFFMPDYGSRLTSAIYIRGIGSRINTPAVGMYVDNIPYIDKSAFDFRFYDIEHVEVLRGPQGTLYGRNTMGGLIRVSTRNPFRYQGTDVRLSYATADNHRDASVTHYHRVSSRLAFSAGGYYEGGDGFFRNSLTGHRVDNIQAGGGRIRLLALPSDNLKFDFTASYDHSDEGAYPYYFVEGEGVQGVQEVQGVQGANSQQPWAANGQICANRAGSYRRSLFNSGLNITYTMPRLQLSSITGFQRLRDRMFMDQDFINLDYYTLEQKQRLSVLSEELTLKSRNSGAWNWVSGVSTFYQWLHTDAPVTFYDDGVSEMIEGNVNSIFTDLKSSNPRMPDMALALQDRQFTVSSDMNTPVWSGAVFHQSVVNLGNWSLTAGARLEYEKTHLDYSAGCTIPYNFSISMPPMMNQTYQDLKAAPQFAGNLSHSHLQFLPRLALAYSLPATSSLLPAPCSLLPATSIYASVSKGYRSGGYNIQMFSDLVQSEMRNQMIDGVNTVSQGMMARFVDLSTIKAPDPDISSVEYKPEYSWNYEIGATINLLLPSTCEQSSLTLRPALFYIDTRDQQIARFAGDSGLGRMMVNAGHSRSLGAELSATCHFPSTCSLLPATCSLSYAFTDARFLSYDDGHTDYSDNYVPFVPRHTLHLALQSRSFSLLPSTCEHRSPTFSFGADFSGAGRIYWTEANDAWQDFYCTLGAHISVDFPQGLTLTFWGKNLTDTSYDTFLFQSMNRTFAQRGKPLQFGLDLKWHF